MPNRRLRSRKEARCVLVSSMPVGSPAILIPMANLSASHRIGRKRRDYEAKRVKGVFVSENVHNGSTLARFSRFKTPHPSEIFHEIFLSGFTLTCIRVRHRYPF